MIYKKFAAVLRDLRKNRGLSQEGLAERAGVSVRSLRYWEAGEKEPRGTELEGVLTALAVTEAEKQQVYALISRPRTHPRIARVESPLEIPLPHLGDLLRAMRQRSHKTQEQLAAEIGVSLTTLMRWETLRSYPTPENLLRLCALLNAPPEEAAVLNSRSLLVVPESGATTLDRLRVQFDHLVVLKDRYAPLCDLYALSLIRSLVLMKPDNEEAKRLLGSTLMNYGYILHYKGETAKAKKAVQNAKAIFTEMRAFGSEWGATLNLLSNFVGGSSDSDLARAKFMLRNVPYAATGNVRMQLLCDSVIYLSQSGKHEEAHRVMQQVDVEFQSHQEEAVTRHYYFLVSGKMHLLQGNPALALHSLKAAADIYSHSPYLFVYQAQAAFQIGEKGEGSRLMQQALNLVADTPFSDLRQRVHRFAQQFSV